MSKHILKISDNKYETNRFCPICECIDKIYDKIKTQKDIENLETLLVNGYGLVDVLEANNMTSKYKYLQNVPSYHDDIYNKALAQIEIKIQFIIHITQCHHHYYLEDGVKIVEVENMIYMILHFKQIFHPKLNLIMII